MTDMSEETTQLKPPTAEGSALFTPQETADAASTLESILGYARICIFLRVQGLHRPVHAAILRFSHTCHLQRSRLRERLRRFRSVWSLDNFVVADPAVRLVHGARGVPVCSAPAAGATRNLVLPRRDENDTHTASAPTTNGAAARSVSLPEEPTPFSESPTPLGPRSCSWLARRSRGRSSPRLPTTRRSRRVGAVSTLL